MQMQDLLFRLLSMNTGESLMIFTYNLKIQVSEIHLKNRMIERLSQNVSIQKEWIVFSIFMFCLNEGSMIFRMRGYVYDFVGRKE